MSGCDEGAPKLVAALAEVKSAPLAYYALRYVRDITETQRTTLCDVIVGSGDARWARWALLDGPDLTESQRTGLQKIARTA
jgi:hypothetical protein